MGKYINSDRKLQNKALKGILLMIIGLALYPLADAFVKHLMGLYPVHQTTFLRAVTRLIPLMIAVYFQGGFKAVLSTKHPKRHILRLIVSLAYTYSFMYAFSMGSLTTIYTISYTSSFFMIILSSFILKETIEKEKWIAVCIGMVGVVIAMRPTTNVFEAAALLVLVGTFLGALNKILIRRLASTEHSLAIAIYPNVLMIIITFPFLFHTWTCMPWEHWGLFIIVGMITASGQYCITQALRYAQGSTLAPIDYSTFFWVVALDFFWWQRIPDLYTILGALIIVGSNLYILYRTRKEETTKSS